MDMSILQPGHTYQASKPIRISTQGNMYKINVAHHDHTGSPVRNVEIWATKEAVQKHLGDNTGYLHKYQLQQFAKQTYTNQLRKHEGNIPNKGMLVTTDAVKHGDPKLWPHTLAHPEIKL